MSESASLPANPMAMGRVYQPLASAPRAGWAPVTAGGVLSIWITRLTVFGGVVGVLCG